MFKDSDALTEIRWYKVPADRPFLPVASMVQNEWWRDENGPRGGMEHGNVVGQGPDLGPWPYSREGPGELDQFTGHFCGTEQQWAGDLSIARQEDSGDRTCCGVFPGMDLGGEVVLAGGVEVSGPVPDIGGVEIGGEVVRSGGVETGGVAVAVGGVDLGGSQSASGGLDVGGVYTEVGGLEAGGDGLRAGGVDVGGSIVASGGLEMGGDVLGTGVELGGESVKTGGVDAGGSRVRAGGLDIGGEAVAVGGIEVGGEEEMPFSGARVTLDGDQTVSNTVVTTLNWTNAGSTFYDTDAYWSSGAPDLFTVPSDGYYRITARINWDEDGNGNRDVQIWKVGGGAEISENLIPATPDANTIHECSVQLQLMAGDQYRVKVDQSSGTTRTVKAVVQITAFEIVKLG